MLQELILTHELQVEIEGRVQSVQVSVEYFREARIDAFFISAITETGFDLCSGSHGYYDYHVKSPQGMRRLRSEASIANVMLQTLEGLIAAIERDSKQYIIAAPHTVTAKVSGTDLYVWVKGLEFTKVSNVHSAQSGRVISWYEHDVFTQGDLEVTITRSKEGQLQLHADENVLYDKAKLQALHDGERFQNSGYAFFNYNEVRRLLGLPIKENLERMSGLMPSEVSE